MTGAHGISTASSPTLASARSLDRAVRYDSSTGRIAIQPLYGVTGKPFNFVGAAALQLMLAQQAGLAPGELVWVGGDVHLYLNHLEQARLQLTREPRPLPKLVLKRRAADIDDCRITDFEVEDYAPHASISAEVAV